MGHRALLLVGSSDDDIGEDPRDVEHLVVGVGADMPSHRPTRGVG
jgi:hypothetical protein